MTGHFLALAVIGLSLLMGGYILLLAPFRRANQLFAAILILPRTADILSIVAIQRENTSLAYYAAYADLLALSFSLAATIHFALTYPKRTRLSLRTFQSGLFFGLVLFDAVAIAFIGSAGSAALLQSVVLPWVIYGLVVILLRPRDVPRDYFWQLAGTGALLTLMLSSLLGTLEFYSHWWLQFHYGLNVLTALLVVMYLRRARAGRRGGIIISLTQWANWGRWQILAIYAVLIDFTILVMLFTDLNVIKMSDFTYAISLGEGSGIWLGIVQSIAIALILLVLWENYHRVSRSAARQRQQMLILLFGFGIYFTLSGAKVVAAEIGRANIIWLDFLLPLALSATIGLAIVRYRFLDTTINTVAEIVSSTLQLDEVLALILEQLDTVIEFTTSGVLLLEEGRLKVRAHTDPLLLHASLPLTDDTATRALLEGKQAMLVRDMRRKPRDFFPASRIGQLLPRSWIGAPLVARDKVIGILSIGHHESHRYGPPDLELIMPFTHQVSVAVDNARLYEIQSDRAAALAQAQKLSSAISATLNLEQVLKMTTRELVSLFNVTHCGILLFDQDKKKGKLMAEYPESDWLSLELDLNYPAVRELIETQQPVAVDRLEEDDRMGSSREVLLEMGINSLLLAPLIVKGNTIGSIGLDVMDRTRYWAPEDLDLCRIVSTQIASAVANAQAYEHEQEARRLADTLREVSIVVGSTLNLDEVLNRLLEELNKVLPYDGATVWWRKENMLYLRARCGSVSKRDPIPIDKFFTMYHVVTTGEPLIISDTTNDERWVAASSAPVGSWLGAPLIVKEQVVGVLSIKTYERNVYHEAVVPLVNAFATQVAIAVENARLYEKEISQIEQELEIARRTQMSLLPAAAPDVPPFEVAGYSLPAKNVGGDFFQYYPLADDKFGVAVGDVSGKGMPAALMMAVTTGTLDAVMLEATAPDELLVQVNEVLTPHGQRSKLNSACCIAVFDTYENVVHTANAGFIAPLLLRANNCEFIEIGGLPLGMITEARYMKRSLDFEQGDLFIFCSDGIVEAMNEDAKIYGFERLLARVNNLPVPFANSKESGDIISAPAVIEWILQDVREFVRDAEQHDDMTIVVIRVT